MSWTLEWSWLAEHRDLFDVGYRRAERICTALVLFAERGRGSIAQIEPQNPNVLLLRVRGAEAELLVNVKTRTIHVVRVYRRRSG